MPEDTPLAARLREIVTHNGPMPVADFMALCLGDPVHGYYMQAEPFGAAGDFITAPEVSQLFGEMVGIFLLTAWQRMGEPERFHLVEFGPGRGTLMADVLRVLALRPAALAGVTPHLVETSARLREVQRETLAARAPAPVNAPCWHDSANGLPEDAPLLVVANEFFDALPIRQHVLNAGQWRERCIGIDDAGALAFALGPGTLAPADLPGDLSRVADGAVIETQPVANAIAEELGARLAAQGGAGLVIDYGYPRTAPGDTLQAMRAHAHVPVLDEPGRADLTAHVNFEALARAFMRGGAPARPLMTQGDFLLGLGLLERAGRLGAGKPARIQEQIRNDVERLAAPAEMGELFKVLAVAPQGLALPPFND
ncbi:MAG: methyltransferase [Stappia sp.]|uniref:class I SAM-dependent methyltransferase n=1 Tax=Stappia sp. TaxID=1870903 RepID=UPI000C373567|nr:class I SAM-dependent methyltransferase [Stappia sp.]MAB00600.1 methyltransferase [Stappia sp.]MBM18670.1 methyltransferase [Stappia sp.]